ncbi:hypothetical protein D3C81_1111880 [compost metagenome]
MRHLGEQVEAPAVLTADGLTEQLAGQVGGIEAVAGVGLGKVHVRLAWQAADLRQAIGADADHAAPLVVDAYVGQLREYFEHLRPHVRGDILRIASGIMTGAAEQQAPVRGKAVVIQGHALIADRHVLWQQVVRLRFAQGFGGDDVATGGQYLAAQFGIQVIEVGVAAQHQRAGLHRTLCGVYPHLRAIVDAGNRRLFEQANAELVGHSRLAQSQVQRVQMSRAHVDQAANIAVRAHYRVHLIRLHQTQLMAVTQTAQLLGVLGEALQVFRFVGQVAVAPGQVAADGVAFDALADDIHRFQAHQFQLTHAIAAQHRGELIKAVANATNQLPAITPAGAPADLAGFEEDHVEAALGQLDRGVQPGKTATDHTDVAAQFALQRRILRLWQAAGGVVGSDVRSG